MVGMLFPNLRRQLQGAWYLAFSWIREEPSQILAAILTIALTWGWIRVAGAVALCWGGFARVGEVTGAQRKDREDVGEHSLVVSLSVKEPKTRFRAARHQCLKVDHPQLIRLLIAAYNNLAEGDFLSPATLRSRFAKLLRAISLTPGLVQGVKDFDLGSLRAGGATWLLDDPEKVRRRGRWFTNKVMEVYVQEVSSLQYLSRLPEGIKKEIFKWANGFEAGIRAAKSFIACHVCPSTLHYLLSQGVGCDDKLGDMP